MAFQDTSKFKAGFADDAADENLCRSCDGKGYEADYIGLEMKCVQVNCPDCKGTGRVMLPKDGTKP